MAVQKGKDCKTARKISVAELRDVQFPQQFGCWRCRAVLPGYVSVIPSDQPKRVERLFDVSISENGQSEAKMVFCEDCLRELIEKAETALKPKKEDETKA